MLYIQKPNELWIDAAEGVYAKRNGLCAAAREALLVELSRIWKKKPADLAKR